MIYFGFPNKNVIIIPKIYHNKTNIGMILLSLSDTYRKFQPYNLIPNIQVGIYHIYLRDWLNAFSRAGVLVIRLEDWKTDPVNVYRDLIKFLGLSK